MVEIVFAHDQTLQLIENHEIKVHASQSRRGYLGMSQIGDECSRKLWYSFRFAFRQNINAYGLRCIEDGHRMEEVMANKLRSVPGITLYTVNPRTGAQFGYYAHGGHFSGHIDGAILGVAEAPKTWHVWEHKSVNEKKFASLQKGMSLEGWDKIYYAQAQCYMHYAGLDRHYLTVTTPGGRNRTSCRTKYSKEDALRLEAKALEIIKSDLPPKRISDNQSFYVCKMCDAHAICHKKKTANVNCRTCLHSQPDVSSEGARWNCKFHGIQISLKQQEEGCDKHLFNPSFVGHGKPIDASKQANTVTYETESGTTFLNGSPGPGCYSSKELEQIKTEMIKDPKIEALREKFDARVVG